LWGLGPNVSKFLRAKEAGSIEKTQWQVNFYFPSEKYFFPQGIREKNTHGW
jgi:hypothetical protein